MRKYNCSWPGCYAVIDEPRSYCDRHKAAGEAAKMRKAVKAEARRPYAEAQRPNAALYNTRAWRQVRASVIKAHPYCAQCGARTELQVHHIIPPKGDAATFYDADNLTVLCADCHRQETARENR